VRAARGGSEAEEGREVTITPEQIKAARRLLGWSSIDLALNSPVGITAIRKIEAKRLVRRDLTIRSLQAALEAAGVEFIAKKGGAGVRLRK
jgi:ribosome-binding protein aMBF1 (putative translation factor)